MYLHHSAASRRQDGNHVMMFRKNAGSYLHELMRVDAAVQQFTTALDEDQTMLLEGHKVQQNIPAD